MCNIVKALRDEGKKKKEKNLIYSKCVQKKELYLLYCTVDYYCNFCNKRMFDNHELQNMCEKNSSEFC